MKRRPQMSGALLAGAVLALAGAARRADRAAHAGAGGPPAAEVPALAAGAGAYLRVRDAAALTQAKLDELQLDVALLYARESVKRTLGVDALDLTALAKLATDPKRDFLVSWAIVDPQRLDEVTAGGGAGVDGLVVRFVATIPVADPAAAAAALGKQVAGAPCVAAAKQAGAGALCASADAALVARVDRARKTVAWVVALGPAPLAAAAAPVPAAPTAVTDRLRRDGFFDAEIAYATTPADVWRAGMALPLISLARGLRGDGIDASTRRALWQQAVKEAGGVRRLAEASPRLFSSFVVTEKGKAWDLTADGDALLGGVAWPPAADADFAHRLSVELARKLGPKLDGPFASPKALVDTIKESGQPAYVVLHHFTWPHALALAGAHPKDMPLPQVGVPPSARVALDRAQHRLTFTRP
jgi:hypothetical protein